MLGQDSTTLFKQARIEFKAAEAFAEKAQSCLRYHDQLLEEAEDLYLKTIATGVPHRIAAEMANEKRLAAGRMKDLGRDSWDSAIRHRAEGNKIMEKRERRFRKELRVRFSS